MMRIKCRIERLGIILIIAYSINSILRVIFDGLRLAFDSKKDSEFSLLLRIFVLIQRMADRTCLFILFRYILEMREVRNKLECLSFEDYKSRRGAQKRLEFANTITFIMISLPIAIVGFFDNENDD